MIAFEILEKIYGTWITDRYAECRRKELDTIEHGSASDKASCINSLFGIFNGSVKGNIYTYYYWSSDASIGSIYNYSGKTRERKWRTAIHCNRVDFNYRTGKVLITRTRWNSRCSENAGRIL